MGSDLYMEQRGHLPRQDQPQEGKGKRVLDEQESQARRVAEERVDRLELLLLRLVKERRLDLEEVAIAYQYDDGTNVPGFTWLENYMRWVEYRRRTLEQRTKRLQEQLEKATAFEDVLPPGYFADSGA